MSDELLVFGVRSKDGKWFRRKGFGGYGDSWVTELSRARIYNKIGHARTTVSFFAKQYPSYGVPDVVEFKVTESRVIDETERFQKKRDIECRRAGIREIRMSQDRLIQARREHEMACREQGLEPKGIS